MNPLLFVKGFFVKKSIPGTKISHLASLFFSLWSWQKIGEYNQCSRGGGGLYNISLCLPGSNMKALFLLQRTNKIMLALNESITSSRRLTPGKFSRTLRKINQIFSRVFVFNHVARGMKFSFGWVMI